VGPRTGYDIAKLHRQCGSCGHCLLVNVGGIDRTLPKSSGWNQAMGEGGFAGSRSAHGDPTRRITGQADAATCSTKGRTSVSTNSARARLRYRIQTRVGPLCVLAAVLDGDGHIGGSVAYESDYRGSGHTGSRVNMATGPEVDRCRPPLTMKGTGSPPTCRARRP